MDIIIKTAEQYRLDIISGTVVSHKTKLGNLECGSLKMECGMYQFGISDCGFRIVDFGLRIERLFD